MLIAVIVIIVYLVGCIVYCLLNHNRIGETSVSFDYPGGIETTTDEMDIIFESMFWPFMLVFTILLSPFIIGVHLLEKYHRKHKGND